MIKKISKTHKMIKTKILKVNMKMKKKNTYKLKMKKKRMKTRVCQDRKILRNLKVLKMRLNFLESIRKKKLVHKIKKLCQYLKHK